MMQKNAWVCVLAMVFALGLPVQSWATGELHLSFHMGGASDGQGFVGGTLINSGDIPVAHGYVVVTLLDEQCRPLKSLMESFGTIKAGDKYGFRIPVEGGLKRYRLVTIKGFDVEGFEIPTVDDNEAILKAREPQERAYCAQARSAIAG